MNGTQEDIKPDSSVDSESNSKLIGNKENTSEMPLTPGGVKVTPNPLAPQNGTIIGSPLFEVPPPCIKIFSFGPRDPCAGVVLKERNGFEDSKPAPSDDEKLVQKIRPDLWHGWWLLKGKEKIDQVVQTLHPSGQRERHLKVNNIILKTMTVARIFEKIPYLHSL